MLWGTLDREKHQAIPSEWGELVHCRVGAIFTKHGPEWAGWLPGSATCGLGMSRGRTVDAVDTRSNPCLHIVESVDFEKMGEETPTDYYYDQLRKDLGERHPKADSFLLDHLVSLEGFLDKSIVFGFSFGVSKAEICVESGKLLGHLIGRHGTRPDPERCQAVVDIPPLKEKAFRAIKKMICDHIALATFDEASAADGSCLLEQIADASGIAVGGTVLQMTRDMSQMKVLLTHSRSLTPAQQRWPSLIQEAFAQLEVKRATRKVFGTIRTLYWTDHANLTRAQSNDIGVDSKLVRQPVLGTKDLSAMSGHLKGFDLDDYLGDGVEEGEVVAWAVGDDAVPDRVGPDADQIGVAAANVARVLLVMDYARETNRAMVQTRETLTKAMPGISVEIRASFGPFEDDEGLASHFDGAVGRLAGPKRIKRIRVDLLTSCAKLLRDAAGFLPAFVVGIGQGGVIAALVRWPLVVELTLQAQHKEVQKVGAAWSRIKGIWSVDPRIWKSQIGAEEVGQACPELHKEFSVEPLKGFGVATKRGRPDDTAAMLTALRLSKVDGIDGAQPEVFALRAMQRDLGG
eukprot:s386_g42.t1